MHNFIKLSLRSTVATLLGMVLATPLFAQTQAECTSLFNSAMFPTNYALSTIYQNPATLVSCLSNTSLNSQKQFIKNFEKAMGGKIPSTSSTFETSAPPVTRAPAPALQPQNQTTPAPTRNPYE